MFKADNAVWPIFCRNPGSPASVLAGVEAEGTGRIFPIPASLVAPVRSVQLASRSFHPSDEDVSLGTPALASEKSALVACAL